MIKKWLILLVLLFAALASYSYGFSQGIVLFVALGVILELSFWFGVIVRRRRKLGISRSLPLLTNRRKMPLEQVKALRQF